MLHVKTYREAHSPLLSDNYSSFKCADNPYKDFEAITESRSFTRWYHKNKKMVHRLALATPVFAFTLLGGIDATVVSHWLTTYTLLPVSSTLNIPSIVPTSGAVTASFIGTHGVILIHMLIIGFLTLVISTFLKFTGRGDIIPLVAFVGGGTILYEVMGLFKDIYVAVVQFLKI